jgi:acyl-CoA synthetase (AMP-forming)/AMP-acid ligase II
MSLLQSPSGTRDARDVPSAVRMMAQHAGHRPAITLLAATGRQEQSFTSVAQWAAKTAHWLELDLLLEPGDRLGLVGPPGWVPAVAALGAWWSGLVVVVGDEATAADVVVAHIDHVPASASEVVTWGWGFDGAPDGGPSDREPFVHVVQPFPDDPPPPHGTPDSPALMGSQGAASSDTSQSDLLGQQASQAPGTVGIVAEASAAQWLPIATLRPLVTGRPTVLLGPGVDRSAADGDRVTTWIA